MIDVPALHTSLVLLIWLSGQVHVKNVTETEVRFLERPHSLLQRVAARNVGLGFRVQGLGFRFQGVGFKV